MPPQFEEMETDDLEKFAMKLDAARSGATRARDDASSFDLPDNTQENLGQVSGYLEALYTNAYEALEQRGGRTDQLDQPES
mgnify:CR=1 FL=1